MFTTYLRRELSGRRKQTAIVAIGLAVAIALVIVVNAFTSGVRDAQDDVLNSVYGVGTDITVSQSAEPGSGGPGQGQRFDFGDDEGNASDGTRTLDQSQLRTGFGTASFEASDLATVSAITGVDAAVGTLTLENSSFSGEIPDMSSDPSSGGQGMNGPPSGDAAAGGPSSFSVDRFSVTGIDASADALGPLTTMTITSGEGLTSQASDASVAVLDSVYASQADLEVGDTITVGGADLKIIGIATSTSGTGVATDSNVYIPLATAQKLADLTDQISTIYVKASSSGDVSTVSNAIAEALPDLSVKTQEDLASSVTGSLSSASNLADKLGTWLSIAVLAAAFGLAILFTVSGVNRRTRELGTLKAIGWSRRRVVGQVAGESLVQSLLGGLVGAVLGLAAILALNLATITLSASAATQRLPGAGGPGGGPGGTGGTPPGMPGAEGATQAASNAVDLVLHAPVNPAIVAIALAIGVAGGLLAGSIGGWRAARLSPATALRSIA